MVKVAQIDSDSDDERDPLCAACAAGDAAVVAQLIASRADVDAVGSQGETPLATACLANHTDCVQLLLDAGAAPDRPSRAGGASPC